MNMQFNNETFRDDYTFYNTKEGILRFPFPFMKIATCMQ